MRYLKLINLLYQKLSPNYIFQIILKLAISLQLFLNIHNHYKDK